MKKVDLIFKGDFGKFNLYDVELLKTEDGSVHVIKNNIALSFLSTIKLECVNLEYFADGWYQYNVLSCERK